MSMIIDGTNGLTFNNATTQASAGQVLQVVNATYGTEASTSGSTYIDTGLTASITPKFATSKILVTVHQNGVDKRTGNTYVRIQLYRNGSAIVKLSDVAAATGDTSINNIGTVSIQYLDSPATTSSVTYKTQFNSGNGSIAYVQQGSDCVSTITLMEIAA
jgi:hypothetical protein